MIDVHCHLNFHAYEKDSDEIIKRALNNGVDAIINVGTKLDSSQKAIDLSEKYKHLYAIVGVHPHHADKKDLYAPIILSETKRALQSRPQDDNNNWIKQLEHLAQHPKVVGIGEIGMDYYSYKSNDIVDPKIQKEIFEAQIDLAHKLNLPIQIHNRHAGKDVIEILKHHKNILKNDYPGMFHCFAGNLDILKSALQMGFMIGFDGNITYPGLAPGETVTLSDLAKATPLDRLVTETDSPFLTPVPYRGGRNKPEHVILVGRFLAKVKDIPFEEINAITAKNAKKLFSL